MYRAKDYGFITDIQIKFNGVVYKSYHIWKSIASRCYNKNNKSYKTYGGRGVYVCEEWKIFSNFKRWFDENYIEGYELDKDLSGLGYYGPDACVFISKKENSTEGTSRRDYSDISGANNYAYGTKRSDEFKKRVSESKKGKCAGSSNPRYIDIKIYESKSIPRGDFRRRCVCHNEDFLDFEEKEDALHNTRPKRYFYKRIAK